MIQVIHKNQFKIYSQKEYPAGTKLHDMVLDDMDSVLVKIGDLSYHENEWDYIPDDGELVELVEVLGEPVSASFAGVAFFFSALKVAVIAGAAVGGYFLASRLWKDYLAANAQQDYTPDLNFDRAQPSATYGGRFNQRVANTSNAVPWIAGRIPRYPPPLIRDPYFTFETDSASDQDHEFVHLLYCVGKGEYDITTATYPITINSMATTSTAEAFRIGDTLSTDLSLRNARVEGDFRIEKHERNEINTFIIAANVGYDPEIIPTRDFTPIELKPESEDASSRFITYTSPAVPENWLGPYAVAPAGTELQGFWLNFTAPRGLYYVDGSTPRAQPSPIYVQYRALDTSGNPTGSWVDITPSNQTGNDLSNSMSRDGNGSLGTFPGNNGVAGFLMHAKTADPTATRSESVYYRLPSNVTNCQVRVREGRTNNPQLVAGRPFWHSINARLKSRANFPSGLTYIGLKLKALEQNRETRGQISFDVTRKLPNYFKEADNTDWSSINPNDASLKNVRVGLLFTLPNFANGGKERWTLSARELGAGASVRNTSTNTVYTTRAGFDTGIPAGDYAVMALAKTTVLEHDSTLTATRDIDRAVYAMLYDELEIPFEKIDTETLKEYGDVWRTNGDQCNLVFDRQLNADEAVRHILVPGRCDVYQSFGKVTFARDYARNDPVAMFGPQNIVKDSLSIRYLTARDIRFDSTEGTYWDHETWTQQSYRYKHGGGTGKNPNRIRLLGITNKAKAEAHIQYEDRIRHFRRKIIEFDTFRDGLIVNKGDLILVAHDLLGNMTTRQVVGVNSNRLVLKDAIAPATIQANANKAIIRDIEGEPHDFDVLLHSGAPNIVSIPGWTISNPDSDGIATISKTGETSVQIQMTSQARQAIISIGTSRPAETYIVNEKTLSGTDNVKFQAVIYEADVYV